MDDHDISAPVTLISTPTELEAQVIAGALVNRGLPAKAVGGFTAGFKAEAPGEVQVLVPGERLEEAMRLLADIRQEQASIDWSQIDVGDPE